LDATCPAPTPACRARRPPTVFSELCLGRSSRPPHPSGMRSPAPPRRWGFPGSVTTKASSMAGTAWAQKIRRQIRDCDYFYALVSGPGTERPPRGYFRKGNGGFCCPSGTLSTMGDEPYVFSSVPADRHWMTLCQGPAHGFFPEAIFFSLSVPMLAWLPRRAVPDTGIEALLCRRLVSGETPVAGSPAKIGPLSGCHGSPRQRPPLLNILSSITPWKSPGTKRLRFWLRVIAWGFVVARWLFFSDSPRWVRFSCTSWVSLVRACGLS